MTRPPSVASKWRGTPLLVLIWLAACLPGATAPGSAQTSKPQHPITIDAKARPLGEVLNQISRESGVVFQLDDAWRRHPVTVSLVNAPFEQGLKRILAGLNHAVVTLPGPVVRIVVVGEAPPGQASPPPGAPLPSLRKPLNRGPQTAPPAPPVRAPAEETVQAPVEEPQDETEEPPPPTEEPVRQPPPN